MGVSWAKNLIGNSRVELAGWVDIREGAAQKAADELGHSLAYAGVSLDDAIQAVAPDFVVDVTIPEAHHDVTVKALGAGLPVIGEKPMAATMDQAKAMVAASERAGKLYMVSQSRRYDSRLIAYRELLAGLGHIGILNVDFYIGAHFGGFRDVMANVLILDMAIHTFDAARAMTRLAPVSVYAEEFNPSWSWYKQDSSATALFELEGGTRFTYRGCWAAEGCNSSWEGEWRAVGEKGSAIWNGFDSIYAEKVVSPGGFISEVERTDGVTEKIKWGIDGRLNEFLDALETGSTPQGECHDNIQSLAMVLAAVKSSQEGRRVKISEIL